MLAQSMNASVGKLALAVSPRSNTVRANSLRPRRNAGRGLSHCRAALTRPEGSKLDWYEDEREAIL
eukprot:3936604-Pyramimonas_sp.AAC.2